VHWAVRCIWGHRGEGCWDDTSAYGDTRLREAGMCRAAEWVSGQERCYGAEYSMPGGSYARRCGDGNEARIWGWRVNGRAAAAIV
jgi:hypothetical protein